jgi:hypothetical protein
MGSGVNYLVLALKVLVFCARSPSITAFTCIATVVDLYHLSFFTEQSLKILRS